MNFIYHFKNNHNRSINYKLRVRDSWIYPERSINSKKRNKKNRSLLFKKIIKSRKLFKSRRRIKRERTSPKVLNKDQKRSNNESP